MNNSNDEGIFCGLLCEYLKNPIGIDTIKPRFSWQYAPGKRNCLQTAYQVLVASEPIILANDEGDMWDSGKIYSGKSVNVVYQGKKMSSSSRYFWKVRIWDNYGSVSSYSETSFFETGLLAVEDWKGKWIGAEETCAAAPLLRKIYTARKRILKARAYICGLGYHELYINGKKVGDHVLDPNWTDFDNRRLEDLLYPFEDKTTKTALYISWDITDYLIQSSNTIGVMLGNGWYNQRERIVEGKLWYGTPRMILQIYVWYADGSKDEFASDETWKTMDGPIIFNNIFHGEIYDATKEKEGWNRADYDDSSWKAVTLHKAPAGKMRSQMSPPDKVMMTLKPAMMTSPADGTHVFDMGRNISGWVRLKVQGPEGTRITLRFSEELDDKGMLDFASAGGNGQIQKDLYILKGNKVEVYEPRFTWHGFRYVEVTGYPGNPEMDCLEGRVVYSSVERTGYFQCSNPLLNRILGTYLWTQTNNLHGCVPSDCPHRERLGYTGDGQITAEAAIFNFDMARFYIKWVGDIRDAQNKETGFVPHTAPFGGGGGGVAWGSAYIIIPWLLFQYYGELEILEEHYLGMKQWIHYLESKAINNIIVKEEFTKEELGGWSFLGEWCIPQSGDNRDITDNAIPREFVSTFYYAYCSGIMASVAKILGKREDAEYFSLLKERICHSFNLEYLVRQKGMYSIGGNGSNAYPLVLGCVPKEDEKKVVEHLVGNIYGKNSGHLDTGIFGTPLLLEALSEYGSGDTAYGILNKTTYPSFGYMLERGATTLWECWEYENGSHDHPMFGSVCSWFFKYITGIRVDPNFPGYERIRIKPGVYGDLKYAESIIDTVRGRVEAKWYRQNEEFQLNVSIPFNCSAEVFIPKLKDCNNATVTESGQLLLRGGKIAENAKDADYLGELDGYIRFRIGSGNYTFKIMYV